MKTFWAEVPKSNIGVHVWAVWISNVNNLALFWRGKSKIKCDDAAHIPIFHNALRLHKVGVSEEGSVAFAPNM